jgi:hypothetical protein
MGSVYCIAIAMRLTIAMAAAKSRTIPPLRVAEQLLAYSPFSCRKAMLQNDPRWRELLIPFGHWGCVALFEIENDRTVTITAARHHREEDYH